VRGLGDRDEGKAVSVDVGAPRVAYRGAITKRAEFDWLHKKQSRGQGQYARAINDYNQVLSDKPQDAAPYYNRGRARIGQGDFSRAAEDLNRAVELEPENAAMLYQRGVALAAQNQHDAALSDYNRAIELDDSQADAFFRRVNGNVCRVVQSLVMLMEGGGLVNAELSDIRSVLSVGGCAAVGCSGGEGEGRALAAASGALSSAMLEKAPFNEAGGALVSFVGSPGMPFHDVDRALKHIAESAGAGADIVLGAFVDEAMEDRCTVTIIATGLGERPAPGKGAEAKEKAVTWEAEKVEQTVIDFSAPDRGRFADLEPSFYDGEDLDIPTILRRK